MRRHILAILSAGLFVASMLLWVGSLHKPCVLTYHGIGGTVIYSFDDAICLASARNFSASSVGRFGYLTQSTNTIVLVRLRGVALFSAIAFAFALWYQRNPKRGHCAHCGYNLSGNSSGVCPECGRSVTLKPLMAGTSSPDTCTADLSCPDSKNRSMSDIPPDQRIKVDYATPKPGSPKVISAAGVLGGLLAFFSIGMLLMGFARLFAVFYKDVLQRRGGVNTGGDFFEMSLFIIIGIFCGVVSIR